MSTNEKIAVIGLGYVGLPVALAFADHFEDTLGFDISAQRIGELRQGNDRTHEVEPERLAGSRLRYSHDPADLAGTTFFVVTVPTPIDENREPDLRIIRAATETVGRALRPGAVVVYESTFYPGLTQEVCGPILEEVSGLRAGVDFFLGYSPERINPGDRKRTIESIVKVVAGQDAATLERVAAAYAKIVRAGIHRAPSIRVAEAAKVIENTQRDLNIALMNELAIIFDCMGIRTRDVLEAAGTKWNFLSFTPGLVGGHCIGVDPYYLTAKAEQLGYHPEIILAGRRINDGMGAWLAQQVVKRLAATGKSAVGARVGILGLTFKENVPDLRNSQIPRLISELSEYGAAPLVHDPLADAGEARQEYGLELADWESLQELDALILAVSHRAYVERGLGELLSLLVPGGVFVDVKSIFSPADPALRGFSYWSL